MREQWEQRLDGADIDRGAWDACLNATGLNGWASKLPTWSVGDEAATRKASGTASTRRATRST